MQLAWVDVGHYASSFCGQLLLVPCGLGYRRVLKTGERSGALTENNCSVEGTVVYHEIQYIYLPSNSPTYFVFLPGEIKANVNLCNVSGLFSYTLTISLSLFISWMLPSAIAKIHPNLFRHCVRYLTIKMRPPEQSENVFGKCLAFVNPVASLRLVSPGAVTNGVTLVFLKKVMTFFSHRLQTWRPFLFIVTIPTPRLPTDRLSSVFRPQKC